MPTIGPRESQFGLDHHGIAYPGPVHWNLTTAQLYEAAVMRGEGIVAHGGSLVVETGVHTGRSPNDKFVVREPGTEAGIWWGNVNVPFEAERFEFMHHRVMSYLQSKELFVQDLLVGADPEYQFCVRFINELAWHNLFVRSLFLRPEADRLPHMVPDCTVIHAPRMYARPEIDHTRSATFILVHPGKRLVLIGGTGYAGEQKKSIFSLMNYLLPLRDVVTMHCSANYGPNGDSALFFGLSGTGKTTLSADPARTLIGDDEHAWCDSGVFNLEGGCYAKVINLSPEAEPHIHAAAHTFGTVLENVVVDPHTRELCLDDDSLTENTRAAYPISSIPGCDLSGRCGHPKHIIFLTCDAYGVMPPVARLTTAQAMYHFLSGYTARVAGTEKGVTEPSATFSPCFGGPFLMLPPAAYARLLGERIEKHGAQAWLINTGWTGGPYGLGRRMSIAHTRAIVTATLDGALDDGPFETDPFFGFALPVACPGVPSEVLNPRHTWADQAAYDAQARKLAAMFRDNFARYAADATAEVVAAEPKG